MEVYFRKWRIAHFRHGFHLRLCQDQGNPLGTVPATHPQNHRGRRYHLPWLTVFPLLQPVGRSLPSAFLEPDRPTLLCLLFEFAFHPAARRAFNHQQACLHLLHFPARAHLSLIPHSNRAVGLCPLQQPHRHQVPARGNDRNRKLLLLRLHETCPHTTS